MCEIKNELLQELVSDDGIEQTKQNIKQLIWIIDCPEKSCQQIIYASINNKQLYENLNGHVKNKHQNSKEIVDKIKQQQINLMLYKKALKKGLNKLNQNNAHQIPNTHNNIDIPPFENNLPTEFVDQGSKYDNYSQLSVPSHYFDDLNTNNQNQILTFGDPQDPFFDQFTTTQ